MNVDLVHNKPPWSYYMYISSPMFLLLLPSVCILKHLKGFTSAVSGWAVGACNRYKLVLGQRIGNDEETKYESNNESMIGSECAIACGDAAAAKRMIGEGRNMKWSFVDAMRRAAESGHQEVVEILRMNGADVNGGQEKGEQTPLQAASGGGHLDLVNYLLAAGAEFNAPAAENGGRTALQFAAEVGHERIVQALIAKGTDLNARAAPTNGRTALQAAAGGGHLAVVVLLIARGAEINGEPGRLHGLTALQAAGGGHRAVVGLLIAAWRTSMRPHRVMVLGGRRCKPLPTMVTVPWSSY